MTSLGLLAALSVGATACGGSTSSTTTSTTGVVTITMATVGDPGNPSVGVVQTFGGPKGQFVDRPKGTGI